MPATSSTAPPERHPRRVRHIPLGCAAILLLLIAAAPIAGCGGSASTSTGATAPSAAVAASGTSGASGAREAAGASSARGSGPSRPDTVSNGPVVQRPKRGSGGAESNDDNPGRADSGNGPSAGQLNPCTLVSRAQAQAILARPLGVPQEAPLGPTCIYQPTGARSFVTVALEPGELAKFAHRIRHRQQLRVAGRTAYCGDYGQPTTFVATGDGRVLSVVAPCPIGARFAAAALHRMAGLRAG